MTYELRIAYDTDTTLGEADVRSRHSTISDAAVALIDCPAPCKQIVVNDPDGARFLNAAEEKVLTRIAGIYGYEVEEVATVL